ncbi:hypothetical protein ACXHXG_19310 [Rhizobium sp. LEGMi198b]
MTHRIRVRRDILVVRISHDIDADASTEGLDAMAAKCRKGGDLYMPMGA